MLVLALSLLVLPAPESGGPPGPDAVAVDAEFERIAARPLWPGFDPRAVPLEIFDGNRTVLFRHPAPPPEFLPVDAHPGVFAVAGRHPAVTANSSVPLGATATATGLFDGSASTTTAL